MAEVVCLGEALIDFVATESGVGVGDSPGFVRAPGGAPANVAAGVARLGRSSAFLGKVGDDPFGRFLESAFASAGIDTSGMRFSKEHRTGLAFVSLTLSGERDFCFFRNPSADMTYTPQELDIFGILAARIFHFGSITLIDQPAASATLAATEQARTAGKLISYDPNLRPPLWADLATARKTILDAMPLADLVKVSEEELGFLLRNATPETLLPASELLACMDELMAQYPNIALLAVTRGERGCFWQSKKGQKGALSGWEMPVVDTTGAGDGFVAALLVEILERGLDTPTSLAALAPETLREMFVFANAVGALATIRKGAIPSLPSRAEAETFLRQRAP